MHAVIERLLNATNAHDVDAMVALFHPDYDSRQPAHPGRAFSGREQVRANWGAMFSGIPDFRSRLLRSAQDGDVAWCEWAWQGTRSDGQPFDARGVTLFEVVDGLIAAGTLYVEDVERDAVDIGSAVEGLSGVRPDRA
jgi:ketosteroid isomerase-like protein